MTADERYSRVFRSKYAGILLGGELRPEVWAEIAPRTRLVGGFTMGFTVLECAFCGWAAWLVHGPHQLRSHQASKACKSAPVTRWIAQRSKAERSLLRACFGDFNLRFLLGGSKDLWDRELERAKASQEPGYQMRPLSEVVADRMEKP